MKHIKVFEDFANEAKNKGPFIFYTADDSVMKSTQFKNSAGYVKDMEKDLGVDPNQINDIIVKELGSSIDKACYVTADNYNEITSHAKAAMIKGIKFVQQGDFKLNEKFVNEAMSLTDYYRNSDKKVKDIAKEIDAIIDMAGLNINKKNDLLDLITDLTDAYLADMRDEE